MDSVIIVFLIWILGSHSALTMPPVVRSRDPVLVTTCTETLKRNTEAIQNTTKNLAFNTSTESSTISAETIPTTTTVPAPTQYNRMQNNILKNLHLVKTWSNATHTMIKSEQNKENETIPSSLLSHSFLYPGMSFTTITPPFRMDFLDLLLQDYDRRAWPSYEINEPTHVNIYVYINNIGSISAENMEYTLDIFLRQEWQDPRLRLSRFNIKSLLRLNGGYIIEKIWKPALFFRNVKHANFHSITEPNMMISLSPDGDVVYSTRITLRLACPMSFRNYPLDRQQCHLIMGSYSYTADIVQLHWVNPAITFDHKMEIPDYYLEGISIGSAYDHHFDVIVGDYSFLNATFLLARQNGYHLVQTYLPTFLIVMVSFISFWLYVDASPARTTLGVTTLLALTTVAAGVRRQLPPVSYVKAVDIWIGACSIMVFGALLEFALVNYLSRSKLKPDQFRHSMNIFKFSKTFDPETKTSHLISEEARAQTARNLKRAKNVDRACRIIFPSVFLVFNVLYWIYYMYFARKN